jgi:hypothetical protein
MLSFDCRCCRVHQPVSRSRRIGDGANIEPNRMSPAADPSTLLDSLGIISRINPHYLAA